VAGLAVLVRLDFARGSRARDTNTLSA